MEGSHPPYSNPIGSLTTILFFKFTSLHKQRVPAPDTDVALGPYLTNTPNKFGQTIGSDTLFCQTKRAIRNSHPPL